VPTRGYRCCSLGGCGWEGTLAVESRRERRRARERVVRRAATHFVFGAVIGLAAVAAGAVVEPYRTFAPTSLLANNARTIPFGVSDFGRPLPENHPFLQANVDGVVRVLEPASSAAATWQLGPVANLAATAAFAPLSLRQDCAWGDPGRNPYSGTVQQALQAARLPADVVALLERKIRDHEASDRLEIRNDEIRAVQSGTVFEPRAIKMTYGKTLCLNSRVNFHPGHVERADLYEVADARGTTYSVMVPYVCGNISVLGPRGKTGEVAQGVLASKAEQPRSGGGQRVHNRFGGPGETTSSRVNSVPEPETWTILLGSLALLAWFTRRQR
jgi:hypothetical protein